ncbi:MAG: NYN domain-containing protein [Clostridiales bacterium]|jgi:uncharacterized protein (TIGR00288 family)|nr:NYN domain-containing protein [Clostridiales bacterium]
MEMENKTIALLIDADNMDKKHLEVLIEELNKIGDITYKRIYGDFTSQNLQKWKQLTLDFALEPIQQYAVNGKKNVTDAAMVIDAMDILHSGTIDAVCLATNDSDFTRLAKRFKNAKMVVIGAGNTSASKEFIAACHRFLLLDVLANDKAEVEAEKKSMKAIEPICETKNKTNGNSVEQKEQTSGNKLQTKKQLIELSKKIIKEEGDGDDKGMLFASFVQSLYKRDPAFNPRNYDSGQARKPIVFFKELEIYEKKQFIIDDSKKTIERIKIAK